MSYSKYVSPWLAGAGLFFGVVGSASAQIKLPPIKSDGAITRVDGSPVKLPSSPMGAQFQVQVFDMQQSSNYAPGEEIPEDSLKKSLVSYAKEKVSLFSDVKGLQHQPYAIVATQGELDSLARKHFTTWLSTPKISEDDKASVYYEIASNNMSYEQPERLIIAEQALDHLSEIPGYRNEVYFSLRALLSAHFKAGNKAQVVLLADRMLAFVAAGDESYSDKVTMLNFIPLEMVAHSFSGMSDGRSRMDKFVNRLKDRYAVSETELAKWSERERMLSRIAVQQVDFRLKRLEMVGQQAPKLVGHAWFNTADSVYRPQPQERVSTRKQIQVIEFGNKGCSACIAAFPGMKRLFRKYSESVEFIYVTNTEGYWGVDMVSPSEEVAKLRDLYVRKYKLPFTIAVWAGDKAPTSYGGMLPVASPNDKVFMVAGTPTFVVIDGQSRIRYLGGGIVPDGKQSLTLENIIESLVRERHVQGVNP